MEYKATQWLGLYFHTPLEWEIVRHGSKQDLGRLVFIDRRNQRMQLTWTACSGKPDVTRIFEDYRSKDREQYPECELSKAFRVAKWYGYHRTVDSKMVTRAAYFDKLYNRWLDVVLVWPDGYNQQTADLFFKSFKTVGSRNGVMTWQAFETHFTVPAQWRLTSTEIIPARCTFTFEQDKDQLVVCRHAMAKAWFDGDLEKYVRSRSSYYRGSYSIGSVNNHEAAIFRGNERRLSIRWFAGNRYRRHALSWYCKAQEIVYSIETRFVGRKPVDPQLVKLFCD
ncbi:MAG: hypothetical protein GF398_20635 [Chitinivibrionales bacterium]|nr:hypothetical protein [Chitinivibrionales bacterium]